MMIMYTLHGWPSGHDSRQTKETDTTVGCGWRPGEQRDIATQQEHEGRVRHQSSVRLVMANRQPTCLREGSDGTGHSGLGRLLRKDDAPNEAGVLSLP